MKITSCTTYPDDVLESYRPPEGFNEWDLVVSGFWSASPYHSGHIAYFIANPEPGLWILDGVERHAELDGVTGETGSDNDHFNWPLDVEVDSTGNIYVVDAFNDRVQKFDSSYTWQMTLGITGECGYDNDHFCEPWGVALDAADNVYISEKWGQRVQVFDPNGTYLATIGGEWGNANYQLREPAGVDVDRDGKVFIADLDNHRVQKYAPGTLVYLPFAGHNYP